MLLHANSQDFKAALDAKKTFVVDFFATWCGPCKMLGAVLEKVTPDMKYDVMKIDIDQDVKLAEEYEVMVVPTLLFIKDGEVVYRESGFFSQDKFLALVEQHLG